MAVDFEVACREDSLGAMLAAAFLQKEGCRILLLPALLQKNSEPNFLLPVVRGCSAELLSDFIEIEQPEEPFFSWQQGLSVQSWPGFSGRDKNIFDSEIVNSKLTPKMWQQLESLWQLIDDCMAKNFDMPATSISGFWQMFKLLVHSELLRESRRHTLSSWLDEARISPVEKLQWQALVPLISLYRFEKLPLLAFAYGVQTLLKPDGVVNIELLKLNVRQQLISNGAQLTSENWSPVFDGKWYIGVGKNNMVACRSTVYLADSNPEILRGEIPLANHRHDFKRQIFFVEPGFKHLQTKDNSTPASLKQDSIYHLNCSESDNLENVEFYAPDSGSSAKSTNSGRICHKWQKFEPQTDAGDNCWGGVPRLPAMMGGGFLPLTGSLCRLYRVGWHNLPGFGVGGLVSSAHQAALSVLENELK